MRVQSSIAVYWILPLASVGVGGDRLDELDVDLQLVAGTLFLVAAPPLLVALVALGGGQPVHPEALEDAVDRRRGDLHVVVATQVHLDLQRAEVVVLPQVDDLLDDLRVGDRRGSAMGHWTGLSVRRGPRPPTVVSTGRRCCG